MVIGGLISSTLLDQIVTPALFFKFGRKVYSDVGATEAAAADHADDVLQLAQSFEKVRM